MAGDQGWRRAGGGFPLLWLGGGGGRRWRGGRGDLQEGSRSGVRMESGEVGMSVKAVRIVTVGTG